MLASVAASAAGGVANAIGKILTWQGQSFKVDSELGHGSYGVVYLIVNESTGETFAFKLIDVEKLNSENKKLVVQNLVNIAADPVEGVVRVFDAGTFTLDGVRVEGAVMEVAQRTVRSLAPQLMLRRKTNSSDFAERVRLNLEILSSFEQAIMNYGAKGLVHRDIKPGNMFQMGDWKFALGDLDFLGPQTRVESKVSGTPMYMAPEIMRRKPRDYRSDLYSLGIAMAEIVLGENPLKSIYGDPMSSDDFMREFQYGMNVRNPTAKLEDYLNSRFDKIEFSMSGRVDEQAGAAFARLRTEIMRLVSFDPNMRLQSAGGVKAPPPESVLSGPSLSCRRSIGDRIRAFFGRGAK